MLGWTIESALRGFVGFLACVAMGGIALAQATAPTTADALAPNTADTPPAASTVTTAPLLTQPQLDQLVAPIALYPDPLLAQILMASTYPLEVVEAARWVSVPANQALRGNALTNALQAQNWDPSVKALAPFPRVLENMSNQLQWTEELGNAFLAQQADVMAAVQSLRREAMAAGNLKQTPQCRCVIQTSGETISILPAEPQVVCVPVYSPVVYGAWPYPTYPPDSFPIPVGFVYEPGFWIGFGPPIVLASFGPLWGWGWVDWAHRDIAIDAGRYAIASGGRPAFSGSVWAHDPAHRGGAAYADAATRARFDAARVSALTTAVRAGAGRDAAAAARFGSETARGGAQRSGAAAATHGGGAASAFHDAPAFRGGAGFHGAPAAHSRAAFHAGPTAFHSGPAFHGGGSRHLAMGGPHGGGVPHGGGGGGPHGGGPGGGGHHG